MSKRNINSLRDALNAINMIAMDHQAGDLNTLIIPGLWEVSYGIATNYPDGFGNSIAEVFRKGGPSYMQRLTSYSSPCQIATRYTNNNGDSWSDWVVR